MGGLFELLLARQSIALVVVAVALCLFGSWTAFTIVQRSREAPENRLAWLAGAGVAIGATIWSTHFIAMLAYSSGTDARYDAVLALPPVAAGVPSNWLVIAVVAVSLLLSLLAFGATVLGRKLSELIELANAAREGVLIAQGGLLIGANDAARAYFAEGGLSGEIVGRAMADLLPGCALEGGTGAGHHPAEYEMTLPESVFPIELSARPIVFRGGESRVYVFTDLRERKAALARIEHLAHHDPLTDLPNRILFKDRLDQAMARADREGGIVAVMYLDLDRFKAVNDLYGHAKGDDVLRWVADQLRATTRQSDTIARLGGDEFAIVQTGVTRREDAESLAKALLAAFERRPSSASDQRSVGLSIGIALYPADGADAETLLHHADTAVYRVKQDGRGAFRFFEAAMNQALLERQVMESELRLALRIGPAQRPAR